MDFSERSKFVSIKHLPFEARKEIAMILDGSPFDQFGVLYFAERIGFGYHNAKWIFDLCRNQESPTLTVLDKLAKCGDTIFSLHEVLKEMNTCLPEVIQKFWPKTWENYCMSQCVIPCRSGDEVSCSCCQDTLSGFSCDSYTQQPGNLRRASSRSGRPSMDATEQKVIHTNETEYQDGQQQCYRQHPEQEDEEQESEATEPKHSILNIVPPDPVYSDSDSNMSDTEDNLGHFGLTDGNPGQSATRHGNRHSSGDNFVPSPVEAVHAYPAARLPQHECEYFNPVTSLPDSFCLTSRYHAQRQSFPSQRTAYGASPLSTNSCNCDDCVHLIQDHSRYHSWPSCTLPPNRRNCACPPGFSCGSHVTSNEWYGANGINNAETEHLFRNQRSQEKESVRKKEGQGRRTRVDQPSTRANKDNIIGNLVLLEEKRHGEDVPSYTLRTKTSKTNCRNNSVGEDRNSREDNSRDSMEENRDPRKDGPKDTRQGGRHPRDSVSSGQRRKHSGQSESITERRDKKSSKQKTKRRPFVYLVLGEKDWTSEFSAGIFELLDHLRANGIPHVAHLQDRIEVWPDGTVDLSQHRRNTNEWVHHCVKQSAYVIMAISQNFKRYVRPRSSEGLDHRQKMRYAYTLLNSEYIENGCMNERIFPVILSNLGAKYKRDCPDWLQSTLVYQFPGSPDDHLVKDLLKALNKEHEVVWRFRPLQNED